VDAMIEVRAEKPDDLKAIQTVNIAAFGRESEANLVNQLRGTKATFSFVAIESEQIVGHIFFSPVSIEGACVNDLSILGLAPLAVLPDFQRRGVGSLLIQHSLGELARLGFKAVVVLGHPDYYPRLGFTPAKERGLRCEYTVPEEMFMLIELENGALTGCRGTVKYRPEFSRLDD
jgi:putative acetyltransferase